LNPASTLVLAAKPNYLMPAKNSKAILVGLLLPNQFKTTWLAT
jgi:hypothetical protein